MDVCTRKLVTIAGAMVIAGTALLPVQAQDRESDPVHVYRQELMQELTANVETIFKGGQNMKRFNTRVIANPDQGIVPWLITNIADAFSRTDLAPESVDDVNEAGKINL
jgi:hypothetical protein